VLVLSSPSGTGKSTIVRALLERDPDVSASVSITTRPPRPGEVDGRDYHFVSVRRFTAMRRRGELVEHARVFDHDYGAPREPVERMLREGRDIVFDVDWQGARQLAAQLRADVVSVFLLPPSMGELRERLRARGQDPANVVASRMAGARDIIAHWSEYDYVVVNVDLELSIRSVHAILEAERLRRARQVGLAEFAAQL
jgi:guanylate kinase